MNGSEPAVRSVMIVIIAMIRQHFVIEIEEGSS